MKAETIEVFAPDLEAARTLVEAAFGVRYAKRFNLSLGGEYYLHELHREEYVLHVNVDLDIIEGEAPCVVDDLVKLRGIILYAYMPDDRASAFQVLENAGVACRLVRAEA